MEQELGRFDSFKGNIRIEEKITEEEHANNQIENKFLDSKLYFAFDVMLVCGMKIKKLLSVLGER